eukprot:scaffold660_cov365-Pavlova_lutheri.AAC.22
MDIHVLGPLSPAGIEEKRTGWIVPQVDLKGNPTDVRRPSMFAPVSEDPLRPRGRPGGGAWPTHACAPSSEQIERTGDRPGTPTATSPSKGGPNRGVKGNQGDNAVLEGIHRKRPRCPCEQHRPSRDVGALRHADDGDCHARCGQSVLVRSKGKNGRTRGKQENSDVCSRSRQAKPVPACHATV